MSSLAEVIEDGVRSILSTVHVGLPAKVLSYDAAKQQVDVQPLLRDLDVAADGSVSAPEMPVIPNVPVMFPRGGGWHMRWDLDAGDEVWLHFGERAIERWKEAGGLQLAYPLRDFDLSDAVAWPGLSNASNAIPGLATKGMVIGRDDGSAEVRITPEGNITIKGVTLALSLGGDADQAAVRGGVLAGWMQAFILWSAAHTHGLGTPPLSPPPEIPAYLLSLDIKLR